MRVTPGEIYTVTVMWKTISGTVAARIIPVWDDLANLDTGNEGLTNAQGHLDNGAEDEVQVGDAYRDPVGYIDNIDNITVTNSWSTHTNTVTTPPNMDWTSFNIWNALADGNPDIIVDYVLVSGTSRILLGKHPNNTRSHGLFISKPDKSVLTCSDSELLFDSNKAEFAQVLLVQEETVPANASLTRSLDPQGKNCFPYIFHGSSTTLNFIDPLPATNTGSTEPTIEVTTGSNNTTGSYTLAGGAYRTVIVVIFRATR